MNAADKDQDNAPFDWVNEIRTWGLVALCLTVAAVLIGIAAAGFFATFIQ